MYLHIKLCILSRNMCKVKSNLHQKTCTLTGMSCNLHIIMCKTNSFYFILTSGWQEFFISPKLTKVQGSLGTSLNRLDHFLLSEPVGIVYVYTELYTDRVRHHKQHWSKQSVCTGYFQTMQSSSIVAVQFLGACILSFADFSYLTTILAKKLNLTKIFFTHPLIYNNLYYYLVTWSISIVQIYV